MGSRRAGAGLKVTGNGGDDGMAMENMYDRIPTIASCLTDVADFSACLYTQLSSGVFDGMHASSTYCYLRRLASIPLNEAPEHYDLWDP